MRNLLFASLVLLGTCLAGCTGSFSGLVATGSGRQVTRELDLADFDTVDVNSAFNVQIQQGEAFKITVTADDNFMPYVRAVKDGTTLKIDLDPLFPGARSLKIGTLAAHVTMPDLRELRLNGASHGTIDGFTRDLDVRLGGASWLKGSLAAGSLNVEASGASHGGLTGSAQELTVNGSGASHLELANLRAGNARVTLSGASSAQANVLGRLDYDLSGGSSLEYVGEPRIGQAATSGGASARQR